MNNLKQKVGYGFGDFSSSMFWKIFTYYLPFFYTNVFGLTLADAGLLMLITKLWDAVSDPMMGIIADRTNTRWGKYRPYLLWIALPFAIAGVLLFTTPPFGYTGKLIWAYSTYILMMTVYTAINVPYGAMLGVVSNNSNERTVFSSFRMFFAYAGSFLAVSIFVPLRDMFGNINDVADSAYDPASWQMSMIVVSGLCLLFFLLCFVMTRENVKVKESKQQSDIKKDFKLVVSNKPWRILLGVSIAVILFNTVRGGTAAYYFADYLGEDNFIAKIFGHNILLTCMIFLQIGEVANMIGVALAAPMAKRMGKKGAYIAAMLFIGVVSIPFYWLTTGSFTNYWLILLLQVLISIGAGVTLPLVWSMVADVADHSEYVHKRSTVGLIFSSSSMAQKIGGAIGSAMVLWLLAAYGYQVPPQDDPKAKGTDKEIVANADTTEQSDIDSCSYSSFVASDSSSVDTMQINEIAKSETVVDEAVIESDAKCDTLKSCIKADSKNTTEVDKVAKDEKKEKAVIIQTPTAINGLRALMSWIPGLVSILGALIMFFYPLNEKLMTEVRAELDAKREEE